MSRSSKNKIHPLAIVDQTARIGERSVVWQFASVLAGVRIGKDCSVGSNAEIGRESVVGNNTRISHGVFLPSNSKVGNYVFIGPNATFTDDREPSALNRAYFAEPPILEDGCAIGAGAVILPGVRIGKGALIGAGAIITKDVPAGAVVRGEPAREQDTSILRQKLLRRETAQGYDAGVGQ